MDEQLTIPRNISEEDRQKLIKMVRLNKRILDWRTLDPIFYCGVCCLCLEIFLNLFAWFFASLTYDGYYYDKKGNRKSYNKDKYYDFLMPLIVPCVLLSFIIISVILTGFKPKISIIINGIIILIKLGLFIGYSICLLKICDDVIPLFPIASEMFLIGDFIYYELLKLKIEKNKRQNNN